MRGVASRAKKMIRKKSGEFKELPEQFKQKRKLTTRNEGASWTSEDFRLLKELAKQNTPTRVMSIKLGRSVAAIRSKAKEKSLSLKPINRSPYGRLKSKSRSSSSSSARQR